MNVYVIIKAEPNSTFFEWNVSHVCGVFTSRKKAELALEEDINLYIQCNWKVINDETVQCTRYIDIEKTTPKHTLKKKIKLIKFRVGKYASYEIPF